MKRHETRKNSQSVSFEYSSDSKNRYYSEISGKTENPGKFQFRKFHVSLSDTFD
jgi:hypothetical protein